MSTGVSDQRMQGRGNQPPNGPNKEQLSEHEDFSSWRSQSIQNSYASSNVGPSNDPYLSGYYGSSIPYQLDHGAWSSGGAGGAPGDVPFLGGGYPHQQQQHQHQHHDAYGIDVFGPSNGGFGNFGGYDYSSAWERKAAHYDDYYSTSHGRPDYSPRQTDESIKQVEQGVHSLSIEQQQKQQQHDPSPQQQQQPKKLTWASIASQPAKPQLTTKKKSMVPPPMVAPRTPSLDIGTWENKNGSGQAPPPPVDSMAKAEVKPAAPSAIAPKAAVQQPPPAKTSNVYRDEAMNLPPRPSRPSPPPVQAAPIRETVVMSPPKIAPAAAPVVAASVSPTPSASAVPVLEDLQSKHNYNPKEFDLSAKNARFFVIKSYSEDDIHRSIKYEIWCSTEHGNKRLDAAFRERDGKGPVYLFFSVNGSGHFCGMAEMISAVDMSSTLSVWAQDKWRGQFSVKWIYVKDVPNAALRHIRLENNENKPVTNSRDTQEVPPEKGRMVLKILHTYRHATSIFDDFSHYEKRQAEEDQRKTVSTVSPVQQDYDDHHHPPHQQQQQQHGRGRPDDRDQRYGNDPRDYNRGPPRDRPGYEHRERDGYMRDRRDDRPRDRDRYAEPRDFRGRNERPDYDHRERDGYMRDRDPRRDDRGRDRDGFGTRAPPPPADRNRDAYQRHDDRGAGFGRRDNMRNPRN